MQAPPPVADERGRLDALQRYRILGTPPERVLDDLTSLAGQVCHVPIVLLTLIDERRQWFKSKLGLTLAESSRDVSFCGHALHAGDVFVIPDTHHDPRFADNPFVVGEPFLRAYAGAPLRTTDGHAIGTLAVADTAPRAFTPEQLHGLRVLAHAVMAQLELRLQALELEARAAGSDAQAAGQQHAEAALHTKSVQLEAALGVAGMGVWYGNAVTGVVGVLQPGGPVTGLPAGLAPTSTEAFMALVHPDDRAELGARIASASQGGVYSSEFRIVLPGGEVRWVSSRGRFMLDAEGRPTPYLTGVDLDITERKVAEARIRHLNRVYAVLSDINQTIVREPDRDRLLAEACRIAVEKGDFAMAWIGLLDQPSGVLVRTAQAGADDGTLGIIDRLIATDPPAGCAFTRRALESRLPAVCDDIARDHETASWRDVALARGYRTMASFAITLDGRVLGALNIYGAEVGLFDAQECRVLRELADDIGFALGVHERERERQRAEEQRHVAEERFRQLAETIQQAFWMTDLTRRVVLYVSPAYEKIWGRSCESLYASPRTWMDAIHPDDRERAQQAAYERSLRGDYDEVYRIVRPDGVVRWIRDRAFPLRNEQGEPYRLLGVASDITEQRQLEEQLQQAQKMETVGRLAGGIAHDFNNLLTVINGMADLVMTGLPADDPARDDMAQIRLAGDRAAALTGRLLAVSRRQILKPEIVDLNGTVRGLGDMIPRLVGEDIEVVLSLTPELDRVKADPGQIEQVLLNLVVNARDAMPDGGVITIETRNVHLDADYAAEHPGTRPGRHAMVAVSDNGVGMDDATRQRIFEPFFTTKAQGKGTGLGLSMVYGIVKQSGGSIWVYSEVGHGSSFKVYLPNVTDAPLPPPAPPPPAAAHGHETILVVEDEPALRELTTRVLKGAGYTVLSAASGPLAIALLERHDGPVHLVFTDVVMPGMNGRELADRLTSLRPGVRVLYTSGYTEDAILRHGVLDDARRFLSKPYTPSQLRQRVRDALD
jgi:two-component system cell cycle sensor histidine kinase/response regulator CckA